jgi:hypothetical protein
VAPVQRGARVAKQVLSESSLASQTGDCCGGNPASEGKRWTFNIRNQHCVSGTETGRTGRQVQRAGGAWASGGGSRRRRWHRRRRLSAVRVETRNTQPPPLTKTRPSRRAQRHAGGGGISGAPHGADPQRGGGGKGGTGQGRGARPSHCYRGILQGRPQHQLDQLARYVLACLHMPVFGVWKAATRKQTQGRGKMGYWCVCMVGNLILSRLVGWRRSAALLRRRFAKVAHISPNRVTGVWVDAERMSRGRRCSGPGDRTLQQEVVVRLRRQGCARRRPSQRLAHPGHFIG